MYHQPFTYPLSLQASASGVIAASIRPVKGARFTKPPGANQRWIEDTQLQNSTPTLINSQKKEPLVRVNSSQ
jgi:hypothetical protein